MVPSLSQFCDLYHALSVCKQLYSGANSPYTHWHKEVKLVTINKGAASVRPAGVSAVWTGAGLSARTFVLVATTTELETLHLSHNGRVTMAPLAAPTIAPVSGASVCNFTTKAVAFPCKTRCLIVISYSSCYMNYIIVRFLNS